MFQYTNLKRGVAIILLAISAKYALDSYFEYERLNKVFPKDFFVTRPADDKKIYLGFLGNVYDVSSGEKHYGPEGGYNFFAGKDATRAFATGDFENDLNDNVEDFNGQQAKGILDWKTTYDTQYIWLGKLEGAFYDIDGNPTKVLEDLYKKVESQKEKDQLSEKFSRKYPHCNSEWTGEDNKSRFWCSAYEREWTGKPRLVLNPHSNLRDCHCVRDEESSDHELIEGCDPEAIECIIYHKK